MEMFLDTNLSISPVVAPGIPEVLKAKMELNLFIVFVYIIYIYIYIYVCVCMCPYLLNLL